MNAYMQKRYLYLKEAFFGFVDDTNYGLENMFILQLVYHIQRQSSQNHLTSLNMHIS